MSPEKLLRMYKCLLLTRMVENKIYYICHNQNPQSPLIPGKGYLSTGQEAVSVGAAMALQDGDWLAPSHRDMGAHLIRGITLNQVFSQYFCRLTSPTRGRDGNVHFGDTSKRILSFISHMGSIAPVANGLAFAMRYRGENGVVLCGFGDGASSQGVVHEAMNYAGALKLPVIFLLNNNGYAISFPFKKQTAVEKLSLRAAGYGMPGTTVDGNKVTEVNEAVQAAVDRARRGEGPSIVECMTMRMSGHGTHDPMTHISPVEVDAWKKKDPIVWFRDFLLQKKLWDDEKEKALIAKIEKEIDEAIEYARAQPLPQPEDLACL